MKHHKYLKTKREKHKFLRFANNDGGRKTGIWSNGIAIVVMEVEWALEHRVWHFGLCATRFGRGRAWPGHRAAPGRPRSVVGAQRAVPFSTAHRPTAPPSGSAATRDPIQFCRGRLICVQVTALRSTAPAMLCHRSRLPPSAMAATAPAAATLLPGPVAGSPRHGSSTSAPSASRRRRLLAVRYAH
jgi:hypothetical protein